MAELGEEVKVRVHVDATAAKAIAERSGLDKLRHIDVNILWIQEQEARDRLPLVKVSGKINPADLMTKYVEGELIKSHMKTMNIGFREGRAQLAAQLYGLGQGGERRPKEGEETRGSEGKEERRRGDEKGGGAGAGGQKPGGGEGGERRPKEGKETRGPEEGQEDKWLCRGRGLQWVRHHRQPREDLFNLSEAAKRQQNLKLLWGIRKTEGTMQDGRKFSITDEWDHGASQDRRMRQSWIGTTTFICRTPDNKIDKMSSNRSSNTDGGGG